jgi:hypothetical protein
MIAKKLNDFKFKNPAKCTKKRGYKDYIFICSLG